MTSQTSRKEPRARRPEPIPTFSTPEEEASFWDTHDVADYWDEFQPAKVRFAKNLSQGITIRLDPETLDLLRKTAHERGIGPTTLVRMWILEHLRVELRLAGATAFNCSQPQPVRVLPGPRSKYASILMVS
ncbi:MAG: hypothetical protein EXR52_02720 [Dehalococcoidia bacterium]|nr:hypothetical protein [Dehalococcoidia bacterium]